MQIKDIFLKDISRPINGVVKADQMDEPIVWQELEEYVVTKELDQHFRRFLDTYLASFDDPDDPILSGRIGVWISGFFGSGKSHFIKILSYILDNKKVFSPENKTRKEAVSFFEDKIKDPMMLADIKRTGRNDTDVILFNIDSRADASEGRSAILSVFWKVFNEMLGYCGQYPHIAELERHLVREEKYETFCNEFNKLSGADWTDKRDGYLLMQYEIVGALAKSLNMSKSSSEKWFDKAEESFSLTVEGFVKRVNEYLESQSPQHRIVFLVDEIGQFIGDDTHLMLNLQTIVEELGRVCHGRAWVIVTSQEEIDKVVGDLKASKANDFSKIQGRFNTRLSLSSSNTDEVIQTRLLSKKDISRPDLSDLFRKKGDILKSQLSFTADSTTMKNYTDEDDFIANYPFAPYHFQLLQKIFECIRKAGATGLHLSRGERSMLDAFQSAAKNISLKNIGSLVPLFEFYPCLESFLDTSVKRSIDQAKENKGIKAPFDIQLLQTLFLIRYIDIVKPNVENLVTLCIDEVDADRIKIRQNIEESLQRLEHENLINRNGDLYFFLTNEERDVSREIKNVDIPSAEETKLLCEIIFDDVLKGKTRHRYKDYGRDYQFNRICDEQFYGSRGEHDLAVEIITPYFDQYSVFNDGKCILYSADHNGHAVIKLPDAGGLEELRVFLQTDKYIRLKGDAAAPNTLKRILSDRQDENRQRKERLIALLEEMITHADYYGLGRKLEIKSASAVAMINEALDYLVLNIFSKFSYLKKLHENHQKEIKAILLSDDIGHDQIRFEFEKNETEDVKEIRAYIDLKVAGNYPVKLDELVAHFSRRPYGWPEWEIVILVSKLFAGGIINLVSDGSKILPREAVEPLTKTGRWKTVKIVKSKVPTRQELKKAQELGKELFGKIGPDSHEKLMQFLKESLSRWKESLNTFKPLADTGKYPGKKEIDECLVLLTSLLQIHDASEFISAFNKCREDLEDASDDLNNLTDFYTHQKPAWESLLDAIDLFEPNRSDIEKSPDALKSLRRMDEIINAPSPYSMISEVNNLISSVKAVNDALIEENRKSTIEIIDNKIDQIKAVLNEQKAGDELRNRALYPIQKTKKNISSYTSIPNINYQIKEAQEKFNEAVELIEKETGEKEPGARKKIQDIKPTYYVSKPYIETAEEVDEFISKLKKELLTAINNDKRIKIL